MTLSEAISFFQESRKAKEETNQTKPRGFLQLWGDRK